MFTQGTFALSAWRAFVALLSFGVPLFMTSFPTWGDMTIGTVLFAVLHYAETRTTAKQVGDVDNLS